MCKGDELRKNFDEEIIIEMLEEILLVNNEKRVSWFRDLIFRFILM